MRKFVDAGISNQEHVLTEARAELVTRLGSRGLVDAAAVLGNFECVNRVANACGIAAEAKMEKMVGDTVDVLNIRHYASANNTPAGRV